MTFCPQLSCACSDDMLLSRLRDRARCAAAATAAGPPGRLHRRWASARPISSATSSAAARPAPRRCARPRSGRSARRRSPTYMAAPSSELRRQTAGIGLDVLRLGRRHCHPRSGDHDLRSGSAAIKPQIDATLLEIARTVKTCNQTYRRRARPHRHVRHSAGQSGAVGKAGERRRGLSRKPRRRQGAHRVARPWRRLAALLSGRQRDREGREPPGRDPAGPLLRLTGRPSAGLRPAFLAADEQQLARTAVIERARDIDDCPLGEKAAPISLPLPLISDRSRTRFDQPPPVRSDR